MEEPITSSVASTNQWALSTLLSQQNVDRLTELGLNLLFAIIILIVGAWVSKMVKKTVSGMLSRKNLDPIVVGFVANLAYIVLIVAALTLLSSNP